MFIKIDRSSEVPIYLQIKESVRILITRGTLQPGERLLSTRLFAEKLGINRMTVEAAFRQLEADGFIKSYVGRGTFVNRHTATFETTPNGANMDVETISRLWAPLFIDERSAPATLPITAARNATKSISFLSAAPGPDLFPAIGFRRCADFVLKRRITEISSIGSSDGLASLKSYLVRWFAQNGMAASEDEIVITTGCQQSMDLIRRVLIQPGDSLILENPTYPGAVAALAPPAPFPVRRLELPMKNDGPDMSSIKLLLGRNSCKLIYAVPNFHNPTGRTMPLAARRQLVSMATQFRVPIVEDDVFGELRYSGAALPTLRSLCPELVMYISSFSKMLSPSLRLGWILGPAPLIRQVIKVKQSADLHTNLMIQATIDEFCRRDLLNHHMKRVRRLFMRRRDVMAEALRKYFPTDTNFEAPEGGLSMWVSLPQDCNTSDLLREAAKHGVQFLPGAAFYFRSALQNSLRLSFATEPEERIREGIRIIGGILGNRRSRAYITVNAQSQSSQPIL
jgi:DNA-binding transcriptional MocR family regulator